MLPDGRCGVLLSVVNAVETKVISYICHGAAKAAQILDQSS